MCIRDRAYVNGRTVFAVMERLTAELFNTFVQRSGDAEPYFTEYCDGKTCLLYTSQDGVKPSTY